MEIVVLDGYTLNPGDLSWDELRSLGNCTIHDRTSVGEIVPRSAKAEIILTNKTPLTTETLAQLPQLRCICVLATGYNVVDVAAAKKRPFMFAKPRPMAHLVASANCADR